MRRNDFISNSSSSCFIVVSEKVMEQDLKDLKNCVLKDFLGQYSKEKPLMLPIVDYGTCGFGWEFITYNDFWSKMNFCAIQLHDLKKYCTGDINEMPKYQQEFYKKYTWDKCYPMFKKVCLEKFNLHVDIKEEYEEENKYYYYIDHQSSVTEGSNMSMFDSEDILYRFLASSQSYVEGGNDNEPY